MQDAPPVLQNEKVVVTVNEGWHRSDKAGNRANRGQSDDEQRSQPGLRAARRTQQVEEPLEREHPYS
jgi:hypothetical protein